MIPNGTQVLCAALGKAGCYFISLCKIGEDYQKVDLLTAFSESIRKGLVKSDGFVNDAGAILSGLTGSKWVCLKAGPGHELPLEYKLMPNEREILRFERSAIAGVENAHFVVGDGSGKVAWDSVGSSLAVSQGKMTSRRILRRIE